MSVCSKGGCTKTQSQQKSTSKSPGKRGIRKKQPDRACGVKASKPNARIVVKLTRCEARSTPAPNGLVPTAMAKPLSDQPTTHYEESRKRNRIIPIQSRKTRTGKKDKQKLRKHLHDQFIITPDYILQESDKIVKSSNDIADHYLDIAVRNTVCHTPATTIYANLHEQIIQNILNTWNSRVQMNVYNDSTLMYKCYMCNYFWWHLQEFRDHLLSHPQMNIIFGSVEGQQSLIAYQVESPKKEILEECPKCGNSFKLKKFEAYLHCHYCIKQHRIIEGKTYGRNKYCKCKICARYIDSEEFFKEHLTIFHDVRSDLPIVNNIKTCIQCNEKFSDTNYHYCFTRVLDAPCRFCFRNFVNIDLRNEHMRNSRGIITCEICKLQLPSKCMIFQHMLSHSGKYMRVLKCRLCFGLKVFVDTEGATIHMMIQHHYYLIQMKRYISDIIIPKSCLKKEYRRDEFNITGKTKPVTKNEEKNFDYLLSDVDGHKQAEVYIVDENLWYLNDDIFDTDPETANVDYNLPPEVYEDMEPETEIRQEEFDGEYDNQMIIDENRETGIDLNESSNYNENDSPIHNDISEDESEHFADDIIILDFGTDESVEMTPVEEPTVEKAEVPEKEIESPKHSISEEKNIKKDQEKAEVPEKEIESPKHSMSEEENIKKDQEKAEVPEKEIESPKHSISEEENIKKDQEETDEKAVEKFVDQNKVTAINTDVAKLSEAAPIKIEIEEKYFYKDSKGDFKVADAFIRDGTCNERDNKIRCDTSQPVYKFTKCKNYWISHIEIVKNHKTEDIINNDCKDVDKTAIEGTPIQLDIKSLKFELPKNIDCNTHLDNHSVVDDKAKLNGHENKYPISTTENLINDDAKNSLKSEIQPVLKETPGASSDNVQECIIIGDKPENIQPEDIKIDEVPKTDDFPNEIEVITKEDPYLFNIAGEVIPSNVDFENIDHAYSEYNPFSWGSLDNTDELENTEKYFIQDTSDAGDLMLSKVEYGLPNKPQETNNLEAFQNIIDKIDSPDVLTFRKPLETKDTEDAIDLGNDQCVSSTSLGSESNHMTDTPLQIKEMSPIEMHVSADKIKRKEPKKKVRKSKPATIKSPKRPKCAMKQNGKFECFRLPEKYRKMLCKYFWSLDPDKQRQYILDHVVQSEPSYKVDVHKKRMQCERKRAQPRKYYFTIHGKCLRVCQTCFSGTLCISFGSMYSALKKRDA